METLFTKLLEDPNLVSRGPRTDLFGRPTEGFFVEGDDACGYVLRHRHQDFPPDSFKSKADNLRVELNNYFEVARHAEAELRLVCLAALGLADSGWLNEHRDDDEERKAIAELWREICLQSVSRSQESTDEGQFILDGNTRGLFDRLTCEKMKQRLTYRAWCVLAGLQSYFRRRVLEAMWNLMDHADVEECGRFRIHDGVAACGPAYLETKTSPWTDFDPNKVESDLAVLTRDRPLVSLLQLTETLDSLTDKEERILRALGTQTMTGVELIKRAGYDQDGYTRGVLSSLRKRKILTGTRKRDPYSIHPECLPLLDMIKPMS